MLYDNLVEEPPADWLLASYLGYKPPGKAGAAPRNVREAARHNSSMLGEIHAQGVKTGRARTLAQMPAYLRTPEKMAMVEKMRSEWQTK